MKRIFLALLLIINLNVYPASGVYDGGMADMPNATLDWSNDILKIGLLDTNHTFTAADDTWADISANEVSGTGYTAGGGTLDNCAVTEAVPNKLDCDNEVWTITGSMSAFHGVIYNTSNSDSLIVSFDFGGEQAVTDGTLTIQWNASGILTISD